MMNNIDELDWFISYLQSEAAKLKKYIHKESERPEANNSGLSVLEKDQNETKIDSSESEEFNNKKEKQKNNEIIFLM